MRNSLGAFQSALNSMLRSQLCHAYCFDCKRSHPDEVPQCYVSQQHAGWVSVLPRTGCSCSSGWPHWVISPLHKTQWCAGFVTKALKTSLFFFFQGFVNTNLKIKESSLRESWKLTRPGCNLTTENAFCVSCWSGPSSLYLPQHPQSLHEGCSGMYLHTLI